MKRPAVSAVVSIVAVAASLTAALLLSGCAGKPPPDVVGKWEFQQNLGILGRTQQWLTMTADGKFKVTHPAGDFSITGGPTSGNEEVVQAGKFTVKDGRIRFATTTLYVTGIDVGALGNEVKSTRYRVAGNTLTIEPGAVLIVPMSASPGAPGAPGAPAPAAPASAAGAITLMRVGP